MKRLSILALALLLIAASALTASAQGLLIVIDPPHPTPLPRPIIRPRPTPPPASYKIKELGVDARIRDQVAQVQVSQSFVNTGSRAMEVAFVFPLPYDGAIDRLTFLVDGKEYPAKLMPAKDARKIYEEHVRRNEDPALLEWLGKGMFKTSVFPVPAGAERKVTLRYSQLLRKDHDLTDFLFPLGTAKYTSKPVEKVEIRASIESTVPIKSVYSPTHEIKVKRSGKNRATVSYAVEKQVPTADFRLFFGTAKGKVGAGVLSYRPDSEEDGYFLLLASPQIEEPDAERPKKSVVCVFDRSGSMTGKKIEQAKEALKFVLNNLREGDQFNIVAYDGEVETFRPEMQRYDDKSRKAALGFVEDIYAGGSTNISGALKTALGMLQDSDRPNYVLFMTDGLPTAGETNEAKIVTLAGEANKVRARMINFGVGYDVNSRLLDRLSRANRGTSEFVRPNEDIEAHVSRLYSRISSPVMTDVSVKFEFDELKTEKGSPIRRMYPKELTDLFEGEQLVIVGRYKKSGRAKVKIAGQVGKETQKLDFPVKLVKQSDDQSYAFVEKLWAMRRIGEIIDDMDLNGRNEELVKELVALSTKHGVLTPYTSFLADENADVSDLAAGSTTGRRRAGELLHRLEETEGRAAFAQRGFKKALMEADSAAMPTAPAGEPAPADGFGLAGPGLRPGTAMPDLDRDKAVAVQSVQVVAGKVFYKRANVWYAFDVAKRDAKKLAADAKVVKRFSREYFDLVGRAKPAEVQALSRQKDGEEMMLEVDGDVYHVK